MRGWSRGAAGLQGSLQRGLTRSAKVGLTGPHDIFVKTGSGLKMTVTMKSG